MCGIGGTAGGRPDASQLERMAARMHKRGPDGQGVWHDDVVGLAVRRLAIIDLHERSNQPFHLGALHLVFNGEIYNYRELRDELRALGHAFETEGDGEVLLHAWAEWRDSALDRVNGMFAAALWDAASRRLVLAADPFGEKPLYYARLGDRLAWASDIKALFEDPAVPRAAREESVAAYLARGAMPPVGESFFAGVERLPAAHMLEWRDGEIRLRRYWQPRTVDVPALYEDAVDELRALLTDSIRLRLRSDVAVGTSLSGGIDSSTVVMLSAELAGDHTRHAFTARFAGWERDEWPFAAEVATRAGVAEHHAVDPTPEDVVRDLDALVLDHEEPVISLSVYAQWRVNQEAKAVGVTVLLDGQGGDELFAGYLPTTGFVLRELGARAAAAEVLADPRVLARAGVALAIDRLPRPLRRIELRRRATEYAAPGVVSTSLAEHADGAPFAGERPLRRQLLAQSFASSLPHLLRYADRSSMAWSREVRLPYLDRRVAELALSLPPEFVLKGGTTKRILRDVGRGRVPDAVLARRDKVGFEPPQRRWLAEPHLRNLVAEVLLDPRARARGVFDTTAIERDVRDRSWRDPDGIWRALNVELWFRSLVERPPGATVDGYGPDETSSISSASRPATSG
jgi:asparagine synthase (glutamine-hydrolysing)